MTPQLPQAKLLVDLNKSDIVWVQSQLIKGEFLKGNANGIAERATLNALAEFKESNYLEFPESVGQSTIAALGSIEAPDPVSEQVPAKITSNVSAGTKTGSFASLPVVGTVHANEWIVDGIPLTWGEMTKGLDRRRLPNTMQLVNNLLRFARVFGEVRDKYGKPIAVTSGYRSHSENTRIGGAKLSQHMNAIAADIVPSDGDFKRLLEVLKSNSKIGGIGLGQRRGFLHFDLRSGRVIFKY